MRPSQEKNSETAVRQQVKSKAEHQRIVRRWQNLVSKLLKEHDAGGGFARKLIK